LQTQLGNANSLENPNNLARVALVF